MSWAVLLPPGMRDCGNRAVRPANVGSDILDSPHLVLSEPGRAQGAGFVLDEGLEGFAPDEGLAARPRLGIPDEAIKDVVHHRPAETGAGLRVIPGGKVQLHHLRSGVLPGKDAPNLLHNRVTAVSIHHLAEAAALRCVGHEALATGRRGNLRICALCRVLGDPGGSVGPVGDAAGGGGQFIHLLAKGGEHVERFSMRAAPSVQFGRIDRAIRIERGLPQPRNGVLLDLLVGDLLANRFPVLVDGAGALRATIEDLRRDGLCRHFIGRGIGGPAAHRPKGLIVEGLGAFTGGRTSGV